MEIKELMGYERCTEEEWDREDDLARAIIEFEDGIGTPTIWLKIAELTGRKLR